MNAALPIPASENAGILKPGRLWSLWDVINISLTGLVPLIQELATYQALIDTHPSGGVDPVDPKVAERFRGWLKIASVVASEFELKAADDRIAIIKKKLDKGMTWRDFSVESRVLNETIRDGLKGQLIYRYFDEPAIIFKRWKEDWKLVIDKFPSSAGDVRAAVDCWALGHGTASIFHSMRVLEHGLRALAADVGKNFDIQNWQNILDQIESEVRRLGKSLPAGMTKSERLQFLSEAAKELFYFKDGWRNYVSHNRATYDVHQARSVMDHVRSFMIVLSSRLSELPASEQSMQEPA